jgi:hypothetical protein
VRSTDHYVVGDYVDEIPREGLSAISSIMGHEVYVEQGRSTGI